MASPTPIPPKTSVMTRLLNGQQLSYQLVAGAGSAARSAGPFKLILAGIVVTAASIMSFDREFSEQRKTRLIGPQTKPTALNKVENSLIVKLDRPWWTSMGLGFFSSMTKPMIVGQKVVSTVTGQEVPQSELLKAMLERGIVPMITNGYRVMASPDMYVRVAEDAANRAVEAAKQRMWRLPWEIVTFQVPITKVMDEYVRLRNATDEATRQAATACTDGIQVYNAAFRYYTTSKLFEYAGGIGAGALTAFAYNRYLAGPAESYFGPGFRTMTRVATMPVRPMVPLAAARQFGTLLARRSPLAVLLLLQGLGTIYHTQNEFRKFMNDLADSYPELASQVVQKLKE